jgi:hypothetical protein
LASKVENDDFFRHDGGKGKACKHRNTSLRLLAAVFLSYQFVPL